MSKFLPKLFKSSDRKNWRRDMLIIPHPNEVTISTEFTRGLGRRLPCYDLSENVIIVKAEGKSISAGTGGSDEGSLQLKEKKETLMELRKRRPSGFKEFEIALGSQDLEEEVALQLWEDIFKP
ncbi:unnamed protein product, partial [Pocillopora meandrina]